MEHISEIEQKAKQKLEPAIYDFIAGGAGDERGIANNVNAFKKYQIVPRVLKNVSKVDTSLEIFNSKISCPIIIGPTAFHKLVCEEGECETAVAAHSFGTIMTLSTLSTCSIEDVAHATPFTKWFQLYFYKNQSITENLVSRAENAGYEALVVTVDVPAMGMRLRDINNCFTLPSNITPANFAPESLHSLNNKAIGSMIKAHTDAEFDASLTWESIDWLRSITKLPILIKGILHVEDAHEALAHSVSGIIVSNHGGRQINDVVASIDALKNITPVINKKIPIFIDGGVRNGEDIFKSLALGATGVLIGRPVLWSLALGGKSKLISVLKKCHEELTLTMKLSGCANLKTIHQLGFSLIADLHS